MEKKVHISDSTHFLPSPHALSNWEMPGTFLTNRPLMSSELPYLKRIKSDEKIDIISSSEQGSHEKLPITISLFQVISAGWNICNSWAAPAATLALSIESGGTVTVIYGIFVIVFVMGATGFSLAELAARYPTAGGQYHWTAYLSPQKVKRGLVRLFSTRMLSV
jgi:hypothetical protein